MAKRAYGAPVRLAAPEAAPAPEETGPVWIQIAREGRFNGYRDGALEFTAATFEKLIANFRAHPAYEAGPDGVGKARVVPFDYEHASEMDPTAGSIPVQGVPAPAWALDLQVKPGPEGAELWALTDLSEQAREQIRSGGYQWTSVAIWKNGVDPVSGASLGPVLTSIAFTNKPFIQGMEPMRAKAEIWGHAESPEELIIGLRGVFELPPTATVEEISAQLARVPQALQALPGSPIYGGAERVLTQLRTLLGLPLLSTPEEIIRSAGQALAGLSTSTANPPANPATNEEPPMAELNAALARLFGVRDHNDAILAAAEKAAKSGDVLDQLMALFGSEDTRKLLGEAAQAIDKAKKAEELLGALSAANDKLAGYEQKEAEAEVEQVAASLGLAADVAARVRPLLLKERLACAGDEKALAAFRAQYPVRDPSRAILTQSISSAPSGVGPVDRNTSSVHPLDTYPGRNRTEKALAYLTDKRPGFVKLAQQDRVREAGAYLRAGAPLL